MNKGTCLVAFVSKRRLEGGAGKTQQSSTNLEPQDTSFCSFGFSIRRRCRLPKPRESQGHGCALEAKGLMNLNVFLGH